MKRGIRNNEIISKWQEINSAEKKRMGKFQTSNLFKVFIFLIIDVFYTQGKNVHETVNRKTIISHKPTTKK